MKKSSKKIIHNLGYIFYLLTILCLIDYAFYQVRFGEILKKIKREKKDTPPSFWVKNIDELTMLRLGSIATDRKGHFLNFDKEKKDGVIRIGCFGDSFTEGLEVEDGYDYPALLQDIFNKNGYNNVEVINFGNGWHSFSQVFILWKEIGSKYNLDYALFGPVGFFNQRELTFNHTHGSDIYFMHSRFILKDNKLRLIDVIGRTLSERAKKYYRFLLPMRYIRFDSNAPPFISCLLPRNRELKRNPFYYYRGSQREEVAEIYKLILTEIASSGIKIFVSKYPSHQGVTNAINIVKHLNRENMHSAYFFRQHLFPYMMKGGHNSPLGNELVAQQMFDFITKKQKSQLTVLKTNDLNTQPPAGDNFKKKRLYEYDYIKIKLGDIDIGRFENISLKYFNKFYNPVSRQDNFSSLLAVKNKDNCILDAFFVPINFELSANQLLEICIYNGRQREIYPLGNIRMLNPNLGIGIFESENIVLNHFNKNVCYKPDPNLLRIIKKKARMQVLLNGKPILTAIQKSNTKDLEFFPLRYNFRVLRSKGGAYVDTANIQKSGIIYLCLGNYKAEEFRVPFAEWIKETELASFN